MTGRLPFDPSRLNRGKRAEPGGETPSGSVVRSEKGNAQAPWSVTQLAARVDSAIKSGVKGRIRVVGEISSLSNRTHWYFSLKDEGAVISAVVFASAARKVSVLPSQGDRVIATGRLDFYAPSGRVSLIVEQLEHVGQGSLEKELKVRVETLRDRGWLDPATKSALSDMPARIAVVTSKDGAAVHDVIDTARKRCPHVPILVVDVRVQGERAAGEVAIAIRLLSESAEQLGLDAILVTRGGGSMEDLWAFNELVVAEAIHDATIPVVAAVGHETDVTLAELVADVRAATPTQAVMHLLPDAASLDEELSAYSKQIRASLLRSVIEQRDRVNRIARRPMFTDPARALDASAERLRQLSKAMQSTARARVLASDRRLHQASARLERHQPSAIQARREEYLRALSGRLGRAIQNRLIQSSESLDALHRELHAIGPMQVLLRGYSVTTASDGKLVRSPAQIRSGDELLTRMANGSIRSRVVGGPTPDADKSSDSEPAQTPPPRRRASVKRLKPDDRSQMDLF